MRQGIGYGVAATLFVLLSPAAAGQQAPLVVGGPQANQGPVLKQGTELRMATLTELHSNRQRVGERIDLEVREPVTLMGQTVIPAGTRAVGEITRRKDSGMWGKGGKLEFRPLYIKLGDRQIRISGTSLRDKGKAGTAGVVASVVFLPVAGFFVKGKSAKIPAGTSFVAYLDEDVPVVFAGPIRPNVPAAQQPIVVPVSN